MSEEQTPYTTPNQRVYQVRALSAAMRSASDDLVSTDQMSSLPVLSHLVELLTTLRIHHLLLTTDTLSLDLRIQAEISEVEASEEEKEALHARLYSSDPEERHVGMIAVFCPTCQKLLHRPARKLDAPAFCPRCLTEVA